MHFVRFDGDRSPQVIFVDVTRTAALSAVSSALKKPYCRVKRSIINIGTADAQADHLFELRDAVSLNFDLLFTSLQQPSLKTNCFFLNANLACFSALRSTAGTLISGIFGVRSRAFAN
jgi:hypothetical protein